MSRIVSTSPPKGKELDRSDQVDQPGTPTGAVLPATFGRNGDFWRRTALAGLAVSLSFLLAAIPIIVSGKNPLLAYWALARGACGSVDSIAFALNKSTPYILAGV